MMTLEVYGKIISWPEDFALLMMKYYENNGVPFIVHRDCTDTDIASATGGRMKKSPVSH